MSPDFQHFKEQINNPFKFRLFMLQRLPSALFAGLRIKAFDEQHSIVTVKYTWFNQNPFRSMYFAIQCMAAEMSTGLLASGQVHQRNPAVSMLVIGLEAKRVFNRFKAYSETLDNHIDIIYNTKMLLSSIKTLIKQTIGEIEDRGFEETPNKSTSLVTFTLQYLKHSLTILFLSIQEINQEHLERIFSPEDFHLLELEQPLDTMQEIHCMLPDPIQQTPLTVANQKALLSQKVEPRKLSFGWKGKKVNTLQMLFDDLCVDINFLNEEKTSVESLVELLTSSEIIPGKINIYLGCKTTVFVFVIDNISNQFQRLTQTNIEKSMCFWTKDDTNKAPTLVTSTNFSKSRGKSKMRIELQEAILATIQKYFP